MVIAVIFFLLIMVMNVFAFSRISFKINNPKNDSFIKGNNNLVNFNVTVSGNNVTIINVTFYYNGTYSNGTFENGTTGGSNTQLCIGQNATGSFNTTLDLNYETGQDFKRDTFNCTSFLPVGNWTIYSIVYSINGSGDNSSSSNFTFGVVVDNLTPSIGFAGGTENNNTIINRTWIFINVSVVEKNFNNISFAIALDGVVFNETNYSTLTTNVNFSKLSDGITFLTDGNYTYNVTITDMAGNVNTTETRLLILLDTTFPKVSYHPQTALSGAVNNASWILVKVDITENNFANITYFLYDNNGNLINETIEKTNHNISSTFTKTINFTNINEGLYFYNVTVYDEAGNKNSTETRNLTFDISPPVVIYAGSTEVNNTFFNRKWIFINVSVIEVSFQNITFAIYHNVNGSLINQTTYTSIITSINFTPGNPPGAELNFSYLYNVTVSDKLGRINTTGTRNITLDTLGQL